jgi:exoribonuclease R
LYLPWTKVPMFPSILSDSVFSLSDGNVHNTITFLAEVAQDGSVNSFEVTGGRVKCVRVSYDESDDLIASRSCAREFSDDTVNALKVCPAFPHFSRGLVRARYSLCRGVRVSSLV